MEESDWTDLETKGLSLIDVSAEDDGLCQLHSSEAQDVPGQLDLAAVEAHKLAGVVYNCEQGSQIAQLPETSEMEIARKTGKCNLRKSLAWDSAFFNSAGVLDPEELSSMIEEAGKGRDVLPTIEEDVRGSIDSVSTLESDNLALESIEAELFKDIRASIQKSSKASSLTNPNGQPASGGIDNQPTCSAKKVHLTCQKKVDLTCQKKVDLTCQNKVKSNPALKKLAVAAQGQGKMMKKVSGNPQVRQSFVGTGDSTASLPKPIKQVSRANSIPSVAARSASLGASCVKIENNSGKAGSKTSQTKVPGLGGPRKVVPRPASSSKSSFLGSSPATKLPATKCSSSVDSSGSSSSDKGKSPLISGRRKIDTKMPGNSSVSAYLGSSKISSSISPASSISDWSSESSSSSTVNQRSDRSRVSIETSSCKSLDSDVLSASNMNTHASDKISGHESKAAQLPSQTTTVASTRTLSGPTSMKPSGLRLPSPKIGFFDGVKSMVRTPNGSLQSHTVPPTSLPKIRAGNFSPGGSSNKANVRKILPARRATEVGSVKAGTQKLVSPKSHQEPSNASTYVCSASTDIKGVPSSYPKIQNEGVVVTEGPDHTKCLSHPSLKTIVQGSASDASLNDCINNINPSNKVDEDATDVQHHIKNDLHSTSTTKTAENGHGENQVDRFCRDRGSVIPCPEVQKEESLNNVLDSSIAIFPATLHASANRTPFADKNIICNTEGFFLKESSTQVEENMTTALFSSDIGQKGNSWKDGQ